MHAWEIAQVRLVPIIGVGGFRVLFARALHLTRKEYPWLAAPPGATGEPFADLQASFAGQTTGEGQLADRALLAAFTGLLHTLIGESLTSQLLGSDFGMTSEPLNQEVEP